MNVARSERSAVSGTVVSFDRIKQPITVASQGRLEEGGVRSSLQP